MQASRDTKHKTSYLRGDQLYELAGIIYIPVVVRIYQAWQTRDTPE